jgi:hypothetical protein
MVVNIKKIATKNAVKKIKGQTTNISSDLSFADKINLINKNTRESVPLQQESQILP